MHVVMTEPYYALGEIIHVTKLSWSFISLRDLKSRLATNDATPMVDLPSRNVTMNSSSVLRFLSRKTSID